MLHCDTCECTFNPYEIHYEFRGAKEVICDPCMVAEATGNESEYMSDEEQARYIATNQQEALLDYISNLDPTEPEDQKTLIYAFGHLFDEWGEPM